MRGDPPPPWDDADAVSACINYILDGDVEVYDHRWKLSREVERLAIEAALNGDMTLMADLVDPYTHSDMRGRGYRISAEAEEIVAAYLRGERRPRPANRPKMTEAERRASNPLYDAKVLMHRVDQIIVQLYPDKKRGRRERAIGIVVERTGVDEEKFRNHLKRGERKASRPKRKALSKKRRA